MDVNHIHNYEELKQKEKELGDKANRLKEKGEDLKFSDQATSVSYDTMMQIVLGRSKEIMKRNGMDDGQETAYSVIDVMAHAIVADYLFTKLLQETARSPAMQDFDKFKYMVQSFIPHIKGAERQSRKYVSELADLIEGYMTRHPDKEGACTGLLMGIMMDLRNAAMRDMKERKQDIQDDILKDILKLISEKPDGPQEKGWDTVGSNKGKPNSVDFFKSFK